MGTMCISGATLAKAGANYSADLLTGWTATSEFENWILQAEGFINTATRFNWTDVYAATLDVDVKYVLNQAASDLSAIFAIQYDMSGYTSRNEAESMINILRDDFLRCISILRDKKQQDFINGA